MTQPDPSIAPLVDPDVPADRPAPDRLVRYVGNGPRVVIDSGEWLPGEVRQVPGWLAARMLLSTAFEDADPIAPPAEAPEVDESPAAPDETKTPRRRSNSDS